MKLKSIRQWLEGPRGLPDYDVRSISRPHQNEFLFLTSHHPKKKSYYLKIFPNSPDEWGELPEKKLERELVVSKIIREKTPLKTPLTAQIFIKNDQRFFLLQEEIKGVPFDLLINTPNLSRQIIKNIACQAGESLARIHQITSSRFGEIISVNRENYPRWVTCFKCEIEKLLKLAKKRNILNNSQIGFFREKLKDSRLEKDHSRPVLCHRDFTTQNVIINPKSFKIAGVLDFEVAKYWKAEWDLTRVNSEYEYPDDNLDLLESFFKGYISTRKNVDLKQIKKEIKFYKCFESLYYWLWGWDRKFKKNIKKDIVRVTKIQLSG